MSHLSIAQTELLVRSARVALRSALAIAREARHADAAMHLWLAQLLAARADVQRGRRRRGIGLLVGALERGRRAGFVCLPWWRVEDVKWLCDTALAHGVDPEYARGLAASNGLMDWEPPATTSERPWQVRVYALGDLRVEVGQGEQVRVGAKAAHLLRMLAGRGGTGVPITEVSDELWPSAEGDRARRALDTTVYRLRRRLGVSRALVVRDGRLSLDPEVCWLDVRALERRLRRALEGDPDAWQSVLELVYRTGPDTAHWPGPVGDRLRRDLALAARGVMEGHLREGRARAAADEGQRLLQVHEADEPVYQLLLTAAERLASPALAEETYRRCRAALADRLGAEPSERTRALYRSAVGRV